VTFLLPFMLSPVAVSWMVGKSMLETRFGPIPRFVRWVGVQTPSFFGDPIWAKLWIEAMDAWVSIPFVMILLLAGLQALPKEVQEAAKVDGAGAWQGFWQITFPLMLPGIVASLLLTFITSFDEFLIAYFLSGTEATLPIYIWGQLRFPERLPMVLALGALILTASVGLVVLAEIVRNRGVKRPMVGA